MAGKIPIVLFCIGIYVLGIRDAHAKKFYDVLPQSLVCKVLDPDIVYNFTCITKPLGKTSVLRTRDVYYQPGVKIDNYHVTIQLFRKFGSNFRPFLIKIDQDMCSAMEGISSRESSMLSRVFNATTHIKNGNFYDPCPVSGRRYEIDAKSDFNNLPDIVQPGEYRLDTTSYTLKDGVRKEFLLTQSATEVRSKTNPGK